MPISSEGVTETPGHVLRRSFCSGVVAVLLCGCATSPGWLPSSGPSLAQVREAQRVEEASGIRVVDVNESVARQLLARRKQTLFSTALAAPPAAANGIGAGDVLEVSILEAPPAMLFASGATNGSAGVAPNRITTIPEQMVSRAGRINVPFAGYVPVAGHTLQWIEQEIVRRLEGKANQPQVLVRLTHNATANVTIVGEVTASTRMPLTAKGELLLDALAAAGGVKQPITKTTLQITRGGYVHSLPLDVIIRDPTQNIALQPGDVITAFYQPLSFTVLGATGKNDEVTFEAQGISLAQALARAGGLNDLRADARAVFVFRLESRSAPDESPPLGEAPESKVATIYRIDLKNPAAFFTAQSFPVEDRDVLYVANAPAEELRKFVAVISEAAAPFVDAAIIKTATH